MDDGLIDQLGQLCNGGKIAPGATQQCDNSVEKPLRIHALGPHMHLLGKSITVELNPGTATAKTLLDIPNDNFDDQAHLGHHSPRNFQSAARMRPRG